MLLRFEPVRHRRSAISTSWITLLAVGYLFLTLTSTCVRQAIAANEQRGASPFDLTQQEGEHPLAPVVRVLENVQDHIDQHVRDYSCTLIKQERIDGELAEKQYLFLKALHEPFSVYLRFLEPHKNREVLFVAGQNDGKLLALDCGFKRKLGAVPLKPDGMIAMRGQKYPITRIGIRNLVSEHLRLAKHEMKFAECDVITDPHQQIDGRSATMIQVVHPVPRREFRGHVARLFLDNELRVPIYYDAYGWPEETEGPPLEESYLYSNLQINNGFTYRDFNKDNPEIFKPNPSS